VPQCESLSETGLVIMECDSYLFLKSNIATKRENKDTTYSKIGMQIKMFNATTGEHS
jgi:hypothetical protein